MPENNPDNARRSSNATDICQSFIVNALVDIVTEDVAVVADESSRQIIDDAYQTVSTPGERREFRRAVTGLENTSERARHSPCIARVVEAVQDQLIEKAVRIQFTHEASIVVPEQKVALYNFFHSRSPTDLHILPVSRAVRELVMEAAERASHNAYQDALGTLEDAIDAAETPDDTVATRVLAGMICHWNSEDDRARAYISEVPAPHRNEWPANLVSAAAGHTSPDLLRDGTISIRTYLRSRVAVPDKAEFTAAIGHGEGTAPLQWTTVDGKPSYMPIQRLSPTLGIRFRMSGPADSVPMLHAYYVAIGAVDEAINAPQSVEVQLLTGPNTVHATESLTFSRS